MRRNESNVSLGGSDGRRGIGGLSWKIVLCLIVAAISIVNLQSVNQDIEYVIFMEQPDFHHQQPQHISNRSGGSTSISKESPPVPPPQQSQEIKSNEAPSQSTVLVKKTSPPTAQLSNEPLLPVVVTTNSTLRPSTNSAAAEEPKTAPIKPRIFLGIFFSDDIEQVRRLHRMTYLNYFATHHTSTPNRTCTLREFEELLRTTRNHSHFLDDDHPELAETCRLVYAFVLEGTESWTTNRLNRVLGQETDFVILNPETYPMPSESSPSSIPSWVRWYQFAMDQQHRWAQEQQNLNPNAVAMSYFDFVAHTDCSLQLRPEEFWKDNSILNTSPGHRSKVFAEGNALTLLSTDLVTNVVIPNSKNMTTAGEKEVSDWLPYVLGNVLPQPVSPKRLFGTTRLFKRNRWWNLLTTWDEYKDQKLKKSGGYSNPQEAKQIRSSKAYEYLRSTKNTMPRILFGIFSMDSPKDRLRRDAIRETYLTYYKDSNTPHRICALSDITRGTLTPEQGAQCQLAYAFVMGSNPNGTYSLLEPSPSNPMLVADKDLPPHLVNETDIVHLNIQENMEWGKTPTWLRYATDFVYEQYYFDYVGKMDADTLLYPDEFLDGVLNERCPPFPKNIRVYGGEGCPWQLSNMTGPIYMHGKIYWMSPDLGRFITSSELKGGRELVDTQKEDWAIGNFVHSHPWPIHRVMFKASKEGHLHPLKNPEKLRSMWITYCEKNGLCSNWSPNATLSTEKSNTQE